MTVERRLVRNALWVQGWILAAVTLGSLAANTNLSSPPRYDGAGYAVLARSLVEGRGYREIDHPDAARHAHFPPGYPLTLAGLWSLTGPSFATAHALSMAFTLGAVVAFRRWFGTLYAPRTAWLLGLVLAVNWRWGRDGGVIRSEPLFLLLTAVVLLVAARVGRQGGIGRAVGLGAVLGAATLTRHVGIALIGAIALDLWRKGRRREGIAAVLVAGVMLLPWVSWVSSVGRGAQLELLTREDVGRLIVDQTVFYVRRLPDQITGPIVEVGTVFRPALSGPMTVWAVVATVVVVAGWWIGLRCPRRRPAALVPLATLAILLVWPFTEAGRFLVPLIPFLLVGAVEGLARLLVRLGARRPRQWAAGALLAASLPYSAYAVITDRSGADRATHARFDAACSWIARHGDRTGPILTRHPGEAFLQTGRLALSPDEGGGQGGIDDRIHRQGVAYLLVDGARYANAPLDPLAEWVEAHPDRVALVCGEPDGVAVYAIR